MWLPAGMARWISALSHHFAEVGLLFHESECRLPTQDTAIAEGNVRLYTLGAPGRYWDRVQRMRRIRRVCREAARRADALLIRGLTLRQQTVWHHTPVAHKAFLMVRSPRQPRPLGLSLVKLLAAAANLIREREFAWLAKRTDTVLLANSPLHVDEIRRLFRRTAHFVSTNVIRESEFAPLHVSPLSDPLRLLFVGRMNVLKGLRELLAAVAELNRQGHACVLEVVAPLQEPIYGELIQLAARLGITERLRWRGFVPYGPKLFAHYREADILVLPTYTEGFPRVVWEAAANNCPVVTTAVGGIPAILTHEQHALLIPPRDARAIVSAIKRLATDTELREHLVAKARELALDFTVKSSAERLAQILEEAWRQDVCL